MSIHWPAICPFSFWHYPLPLTMLYPFEWWTFRTSMETCSSCCGNTLYSPSRKQKKICSFHSLVVWKYKMLLRKVTSKWLLILWYLKVVVLPGGSPGFSNTILTVLFLQTHLKHKVYQFIYHFWCSSTRRCVMICVLFKRNALLSNASLYFLCVQQIWTNIHLGIWD